MECALNNKLNGLFSDWGNLLIENELNALLSEIERLRAENYRLKLVSALRQYKCKRRQSRKITQEVKDVKPSNKKGRPPKLPDYHKEKLPELVDALKKSTDLQLILTH